MIAGPEIVARRELRALSLLCLVLIAATAMFGEARAVSKRVALVLGNANYDNAPPLTHPLNDAADMASRLRELGFFVIEGIDLSNREMREKVREFTFALGEAETGLFYYSGHGLQVNDLNYMAPVDANLEFQEELEFESVPLELIQKHMEHPDRTTLIFLDASRENPMTHGLQRAAGAQPLEPGLAEMKTSPGTMIAFATDPDRVVSPVEGRNSRFTAALLENLSRSGVEIQPMMTDVRQSIYQGSEQRDAPWVSSSLLTRFYFNGEAEEPAAQAAVAEPAKEAETTPEQTAAAPEPTEPGEWDAIKDTTDTALLEAFLAKYPDGFYAELARLRLRSLEEQSQAIVSEEPEVDTPPTAEAPEAAEAPPPVAEAPPSSAKPAQADPQEESQIAAIDEGALVGPGAIPDARPEPSPREIVRGIQRELARLSCGPGRADGVWGRRSQRALGRFADASELELASEKPDTALLEQLQTYEGEGCPAVAQRGRRPVDRLLGGVRRGACRIVGC